MIKKKTQQTRHSGDFLLKKVYESLRVATRYLIARNLPRMRPTFTSQEQEESGVKYLGEERGRKKERKRREREKEKPYRPEICVSQNHPSGISLRLWSLWSLSPPQARGATGIEGSTKHHGQRVRGSHSLHLRPRDRGPERAGASH